MRRDGCTWRQAQERAGAGVEYAESEDTTALAAVKAGARKATRQRDNWKARRNAELAMAGMLLADVTASCPAGVYGWQHPETCDAACEHNPMARCWSLFIDQRAQDKATRKGQV
jgi:sirohydrochlorin ferrochelatase